MNQKSSTSPSPSERLVKDIRRATRKHYSAEDKIRIVLDGLRGDASIAELCRREGIAESMCYSWSKGLWCMDRRSGLAGVRWRSGRCSRPDPEVPYLAVQSQR